MSRQSSLVIVYYFIEYHSKKTNLIKDIIYTKAHILQQRWYNWVIGNEMQTITILIKLFIYHLTSYIVATLTNASFENTLNKKKLKLLKHHLH